MHCVYNFEDKRMKLESLQQQELIKLIILKLKWIVKQ